MSSAPPHSSPQHLRFGEFPVDIVRFINKIYLLTYLLMISALQFDCNEISCAVAYCRGKWTNATKGAIRQDNKT